MQRVTVAEDADHHQNQDPDPEPSPGRVLLLPPGDRHGGPGLARRTAGPGLGTETEDEDIPRDRRVQEPASCVQERPGNLTYQSRRCVQELPGNQKTLSVIGDVSLYRGYSHAAVMGLTPGLQPFAAHLPSFQFALISCLYCE